METTPAYDPPCYRLKFQRADEHLAAFKEAERIFFEGNPVEIAERTEPDGSKVFVVERADEVPYSLGLIAGDFLQNLRASLDHLAWDLVECHGEGTPDVRTYFPITTRAKDFSSRRVQEAVRGMEESVVAEIERRQPYHVPKPEATDLWKLHDLARIDRHRYLHIVATAAYSTMLSCAVRARNIEDFTKLTGTLYAGHEIARIAPEDADVRVEIHFSVGFRDYDPKLGRYSVAMLLDRLRDEVRGILDHFGKLCFDEKEPLPPIS